MVECGDEKVSPRDLAARFTTPFNALGLPAISVPVGLSSAGLPIGLQVIGRNAFSEQIVFEIARRVEDVVREKKLLKKYNPLD